MQVSEEKTRDQSYKKRLVKGACLLVASMSSVRESDDPEILQLIQRPNYIQAKMKDHPGLVRNFCLNLKSLKEHGNVKCMIQTVGNLAVLKDIQQNEFLLKVGLQTIINKFLGNDLAGQKR